MHLNAHRPVSLTTPPHTQHHSCASSKPSMSLLVEGWVSRAAALQRRGRAGRVRAGTCYCCYTRHRYESLMRRYAVPEVARVPLEELVLQARRSNCMHAHARSPAPTVTHGSCCCSCCYVLLLLPLLQLPHPCRCDSHPHLASQCHSLMTHNTTCTDSPSGPRPGKQLPAVSHPATASQGGGGGVTGPA